MRITFDPIAVHPAGRRARPLGLLAGTRRTAALAILALTAAGLPAPAGAAIVGHQIFVWTETWGTAQQQAIAVGPWQGETLRMVARSSIGGSQFRIDLSNPYATSTAQFGQVTIGIQASGATTVGTPVTATFAGSESVTLAPGASVSSDPIALAIPPDTRVLVSLYIPPGADITSAPEHEMANETEYNDNGGNAAGDAAFPVSNTFGFTSYLTGIDVYPTAPEAVVAVGDSITDGYMSTTDADNRWPDDLANRLAGTYRSVVNEGVSATTVTFDEPGVPSITNRWASDVLDVPGLATVIEAGGINDLRSGVPAATLEAAQSALIAQTHTSGFRILLTTLTPCGGGFECTPAFETQRLAYNAWVRSGASGADGVIDMDAAVGGYSIGGQDALMPAYDSGDHLHPGPAGYAAMANAVPIGIL